jgi:hypothetical protein
VLTAEGDEGREQAQRLPPGECEDSCKDARAREFPLTLRNSAAGSTSWGGFEHAGPGVPTPATGSRAPRNVRGEGHTYSPVPTTTSGSPVARACARARERHRH